LAEAGVPVGAREGLEVKAFVAEAVKGDLGKAKEETRV
jgi:hypothetical protein